jgi:hypothetical protein
MNDATKAVSVQDDDDYDFGINLSDISDMIEVSEVSSPGKTTKHRGGLVTVKASHIVPKRRSWLWPGFLSKGKINMLGGDPGCGKTMLACNIAALVSKGGTFPDGSVCPQGRVLFFTSEDDPEDTLVPRLIVAGADLENVEIIRGVLSTEGKEYDFDPQEVQHLSTVPAALEDGSSQFSLLILDSILDFITGDANKVGDVRKSLGRIKKIADKTGLAIIGITHQRKGSQDAQKQADRMLGSVGFSGMSRMQLQATAFDDGGFVFGVVKSNIAKIGRGFRYDMGEEQFSYGDDPEPFDEYCIRWGDSIESGLTKVVQAGEGVISGAVQGGDPEGFMLALDELMTMQDGVISATDVRVALDKYKIPKKKRKPLLEAVAPLSRNINGNHHYARAKEDLDRRQDAFVKNR